MNKKFRGPAQVYVKKYIININTPLFFTFESAFLLLDKMSSLSLYVVFLHLGFTKGTLKGKQSLSLRHIFQFDILSCIGLEEQWKPMH